MKQEERASSDARVNFTRARLKNATDDIPGEFAGGFESRSTRVRSVKVRYGVLIIHCHHA